MADSHGIPADALTTEAHRLLDFGRNCGHPLGGAGYLDEHGRIDQSQPTHTWVTGRTVHSYALGHLLGRTGDLAVAEQAFDGLTGRLRDQKSGGWLSAVEDDGSSPDEKACYAHAFVVLAASTASLVGIAGARELLGEALDVWQDRFFDADHEMFVDAWNRDFTELDPYRGVNGNMHAVEALLAAADVLDDAGLRHQAFAITQRVIAENAEAHRWRIPEHFDTDWQPMLEHNRDRPDDRFQPYGATIGHGLEWSRLVLHLEAALGAQAPVWLRPAAVALYERAVDDGWAVDGADGFVYTTDWAGTPVVRDRMHWVLAEAIATATCLHERTGDPTFADHAGTYWAYAQQHLFDLELGSWHHQLDEQNRPIGTVWPGKPDIYHAVQAMLIPQLPLAPTLAAALAARA